MQIWKMRIKKILKLCCMFAPLIDYDRAMKQIPCGKVIAVWKIWEYFARLSGADFTEPYHGRNLSAAAGQSKPERLL